MSTDPLEEVERVGFLIAQGELASADRLASDLVATWPRSPRAHLATAWVAQARNDWDQTLASMARACALGPDDAALWKHHASLLASRKRWNEALECFSTCLRLAPNDPHAWYLAGLALLHAGQATQAVAALTRANELSPDTAKVQDALAEALFEGGMPEEAHAFWSGYAKRREQHLQTQLRWGEILSRNGFHEEALSHFMALASVQPSPDLFVAIAQVHEDLGKRDEAGKAYEQALRLRPGWGVALAGLLQLKSGTAGSSDAASAVRQALSTRSLPENERALLNYALGKALDAHGEYGAAFQAWDEANAARTTQAGVTSPRALTERADDLMRRFASWPFSDHGCPPAQGSPRMVFIVGMPRSGTTLTERILAAHPEAHGCGELAELPLLARALWPAMGHAPSRPWSSPATADTLLKARDAYLRAAARHANHTARVLIDKAPLNFFNLWLAAILFPDARVIWCRREPRDVAVSIYGENFALDERLCANLEGIGHYILAQEKLMTHWKACLPLPIHELSYEALATHPEDEAKSVLAFAGLPWDPQCLEFHQRTNGVQTPSRWQVRQPVHTRSIGRWRHYREQLAPLDRVLRDHAS